jgi:Arc/MetJ-type ribon-helix-helix transcriptional regulator
MPTSERVTITLPTDIVREIDRLEKDRSDFVLQAVRRELNRRRREELQRSLRNPCVESTELAGAGIDEWADSLPAEDAADLVDPSSGTPVRWVPGKGWEERK